jgi:hypothetical protein
VLITEDEDGCVDIAESPHSPREDLGGREIEAIRKSFSMTRKLSKRRKGDASPRQKTATWKTMFSTAESGSASLFENSQMEGEHEEIEMQDFSVSKNSSSMPREDIAYYQDDESDE